MPSEWAGLPGIYIFSHRFQLIYACLQFFLHTEKLEDMTQQECMNSKTISLMLLQRSGLLQIENHRHSRLQTFSATTSST